MRADVVSGKRSARGARWAKAVHAFVTKVEQEQDIVTILLPSVQMEDALHASLSLGFLCAHDLHTLGTCQLSPRRFRSTTNSNLRLRNQSHKQLEIARRLGIQAGAAGEGCCAGHLLQNLPDDALVDATGIEYIY